MRRQVSDYRDHHHGGGGVGRDAHHHHHHHGGPTTSGPIHHHPPPHHHHRSGGSHFHHPIQHRSSSSSQLQHLRPSQRHRSRTSSLSMGPMIDGPPPPPPSQMPMSMPAQASDRVSDLGMIGSAKLSSKLQSPLATNNNNSLSCNSSHRRYSSLSGSNSSLGGPSPAGGASLGGGGANCGIGGLRDSGISGNNSNIINSNNNINNSIMGPSSGGQSSLTSPSHSNVLSRLERKKRLLACIDGGSNDDGGNGSTGNGPSCGQPAPMPPNHSSATSVLTSGNSLSSRLSISGPPISSSSLSSMTISQHHNGVGNEGLSPSVAKMQQQHHHHNHHLQAQQHQHHQHHHNHHQQQPHHHHYHHPPPQQQPQHYNSTQQQQTNSSSNPMLSSSTTTSTSSVSSPLKTSSSPATANLHHHLHSAGGKSYSPNHMLPNDNSSSSGSNKTPSSTPISTNDLRRITSLSLKTNSSSSKREPSSLNSAPILSSASSTFYTTMTSSSTTSTTTTNRSSNGSLSGSGVGALTSSGLTTGVSDKPKKTSSSLLPNSIYNKAGPGQKSSTLSSYSQLLNKGDDSKMIDIGSQSINSGVQDPRLVRLGLIGSKATTLITATATITTQNPSNEDPLIFTKINSSSDDQVNLDNFIKVTSSELFRNKTKMRDPTTSLADSTTHKIDDQCSSEVSSSSDAELSRVLASKQHQQSSLVSKKPVMNLPLPKFACVQGVSEDIVSGKKPTPDRELTAVSSSNKFLLNKTPLSSLSTTRHHLSPPTSANFSSSSAQPATTTPMVDYSKFNIRKKSTPHSSLIVDHETSLASSVGNPSASTSSDEEKRSPLLLDSDAHHALDDSEDHSINESLKSVVVKGDPETVVRVGHKSPEHRIEARRLSEPKQVQHLPPFGSHKDVSSIMDELKPEVPIKDHRPTNREPKKELQYLKESTRTISDGPPEDHSMSPSKRSLKELHKDSTISQPDLKESISVTAKDVIQRQKESVRKDLVKDVSHKIASKVPHKTSKGDDLVNKDLPKENIKERPKEKIQEKVQKEESKPQERQRKPSTSEPREKVEKALERLARLEKSEKMERPDKSPEKADIIEKKAEKAPIKHFISERKQEKDESRKKLEVKKNRKKFELKLKERLQAKSKDKFKVKNKGRVDEKALTKIKNATKRNLKNRIKSKNSAKAREKSKQRVSNLFEDFDDEPIYMSMYDKVKARSSANQHTVPASTSAPEAKAKDAQSISKRGQQKRQSSKSTSSKRRDNSESESESDSSSKSEDSSAKSDLSDDELVVGKKKTTTIPKRQDGRDESREVKRSVKSPNKSPVRVTAASKNAKLKVPRSQAKKSRRIVAKDFELPRVINSSSNSASSSLSSSSSSASSSSSSTSSSSSEDEEDEDAELSAVVAEAAGRIGDDTNVIDEAANSPQLSPPPSPITMDSGLLLPNTESKSSMDDTVIPTTDSWATLVSQPLHISLSQISHHSAATTPSPKKSSSTDLLLSSPSIGAQKSVNVTPECSPSLKVSGMPPDAPTIDSRCETEQAISTLLMEMDTESTGLDEVPRETATDIENRSRHPSRPASSLSHHKSPAYSLSSQGLEEECIESPVDGRHEAPPTSYPNLDEPGIDRGPSSTGPELESELHIHAPEAQTIITDHESPVAVSDLRAPPNSKLSPEIGPIPSSEPVTAPTQSEPVTAPAQSEPVPSKPIDDKATPVRHQNLPQLELKSDNSTAGVHPSDELTETPPQEHLMTIASLPILVQQSGPVAVSHASPKLSSPSITCESTHQQQVHPKRASETQPGKHSLTEDVMIHDETKSDVKRVRRSRKKPLHVHINPSCGPDSLTGRNAAGQPAKMSPYDIFEFRDSDDDETSSKNSTEPSNITNIKPSPNDSGVTTKPSISPPGLSNNLLQTVPPTQQLHLAPGMTPSTPELASANLLQTVDSDQALPVQRVVSPTVATHSSECIIPPQHHSPCIQSFNDTPMIEVEKADQVSDKIQEKPELVRSDLVPLELTANSEVSLLQRSREYITELSQDGKLSLTIRKASNQARDATSEPSRGTISSKSQVATPSDLSTNNANEVTMQISQQSAENDSSQQSTDSKGPASTTTTPSSVSSGSAANVKPTRRSARLMKSGRGERRDHSTTNASAEEAAQNTADTLIVAKESNTLNSREPTIVAKEATTVIKDVSLTPKDLSSTGSPQISQVEANLERSTSTTPTPTSNVKPTRRSARLNQPSSRVKREPKDTNGSRPPPPPTEEPASVEPPAPVAKEVLPIAPVITPQVEMVVQQRQPEISEVNKPQPLQQAPQQTLHQAPVSFCTPSYLPPRKRFLWFWSQKQLLEQRYLVVWTSRLALKDSFATLQMHFISGNKQMPSCSFRAMLDETGMPLPIHINQRMRLDPDQLEGIKTKVSNEEDHCVLLAVPFALDQSDYLSKSNSLRVGFIDYLIGKQAAGIVYVCQPGKSQPSYIIHIFPPCTFVNDHILQCEPDLLSVIQNIDNLIVVITTA